jgi:hypothetical protein
MYVALTQYFVFSAHLLTQLQIATNLPASEEAFVKGEGPATISLSAALDNDVISDVSSYAGIVIMAALFGRIVVHLYRPNSENGFQDVSQGEFWKRHRKMDGVFSNMVMLLPNHLRLTSGVKDCHLFFLNLKMHALIVALHQAAMTKAEMYGLDPSLIRHSQARSDVAAEEIVRVMRFASNTNIENVSTHPLTIQESIYPSRSTKQLISNVLDVSIRHILSPYDC